MIKDDSSYIQQAMRAYQNAQCVSLTEFNEDLLRIITIKKTITRYKNGDSINVRLLLNQFIILTNVFGSSTYYMVKYKLDECQHSVAFAFLSVLNRLPEENVILDQYILEQLKKELN